MKQTAEVQDIFAAAPNSGAGFVAVSTKIKNAYLHATGAGGQVEEKQVVEEVEKVQTGPGSKKIDCIGEDCPVYVRVFHVVLSSH